MKQNISSIVHIRPLKRRSKSCEDMIGQNDLQNINENNDLIETTSLQIDPSIDQPRHNRFAKENRQKLISQQQAIDQKVKLTRLQEAMKRKHQQSRGFLTKISTTFKRPTTISISLATQSLDSTINQSANVDNRSNPVSQHENDDKKENFAKQSGIYTPDKRTPQHQQQSKMYNINEDTHASDDNQNIHINNINIEGGDEMILAAAKLPSHIMPSFSSSAAISNKTSPSTTDAS